MKPEEPQQVKLSRAAITRMKDNAQKVKSFCIFCMEDLLGEEGSVEHLIVAYSEAIYITSKFMNYLEKITESRPLVYDEETKKNKYILTMQDVFTLQALVDLRTVTYENFPLLTGGRSLEIH